MSAGTFDHSAWLQRIGHMGSREPVLSS